MRWIEARHQGKLIVVQQVACCDNGDMVVGAPHRKGELYIIGDDGESKVKLATHEADEEKQIGKVRGITISQQGHILIVDGTKYVKVFTSTWKYLHCFSTLTPNEDPNGNVKVRDIAIDKGRPCISR